MAFTCRFALRLCSFLLLLSRAPSLASTAEGANGTGSNGTGSSSETGHETAGGSGHEAANITTLPIVSWKWHHVEAPYLVALWVLVGWLCKLGESAPPGRLSACPGHRWESADGKRCANRRAALVGSHGPRCGSTVVPARSCVLTGLLQGWFLSSLVSFFSCLWENRQ